MSRLSRMFEPPFGWDSGVLNGNESPDLNVWDDERTAYVEAELSGLTAEQFRIDVAGTELTISGERKPDGRQGTTLRQERMTGPFRRTITLPWEVEPGKAEATLRDGVLTVRLPKSERTSPKKIKVTTV